MDGWVILLTSLSYLGILFAVAYYGDWRAAKAKTGPSARPMIYALSLAVYCTSWTFFGSVGIASRSGGDFLPVYIGPVLMMIFGWPLLLRIIHLAKTQNITSVADFIAARYGKNQTLASLAALIAVAGTIPYIALQLKAVSGSVTTILGDEIGALAAANSPAGDVAFAVAMSLALFAVLFGTRHIDATEHQDGLVLAIALESVIKLVAFLAVGCFVTFWMFDGFGDLWSRAMASPAVERIFTSGFSPETWITITFLSLVCIVLLPRQFHVAVVENRGAKEVQRAKWLFPLYLLLINAFVVPIALAGLVTFTDGSVDGDTFVLALPKAAGAGFVTMIAFIGGLSAATAMVIVASVALAIMICNDVVVPLMLRRQAIGRADPDTLEEIGPLLLNIRRISIIVVLVLAYGFHRTLASGQALGSIGLLSFAAIAQLAPAFFGGLFWSRANARGALTGISLGFAIWVYTLLLPWFSAAGWNIEGLLAHGPFGIAALRPQALFGLEMSPIAHGVLFSMLANVGGLVIVSLLSRSDPVERMQASIFVGRDMPPMPAGSAVRLWRSTITVGDLMLATGRYLGTERAERAFNEHARGRDMVLNANAEADLHTLRFTEHLLASAIGAASSRLVLSLLLKRHNLGDRSAIRLLDDASEALQYNRDLLQSALDQVAQGIAVFDKDLRLICWNRQFRNLLRLPEEAGRIGIPLEQLLRTVAEQGNFGAGPIETIVADRMRRLVRTKETFHERLEHGRRVLEIATNPMPQGGIVTTFTDITERVEAADALTRANETLERRVRDRTAELTKVNHALTEAKAKADEANLDKTRFLAAASHDILQPLNAARLYTSSLVDRAGEGEHGRLVHNIDASLEAVEDILGALLDISRLDTGKLEPEYSVFPLNELIDRLVVEFTPVAEDAGLTLKTVPTTLWLRSDRRLLRRVLQNFLSNAIKYTERGRVLIGCRRQAGHVRIEVWDTGPGIPRAMQPLIFKEFHRLESSSRNVRGLGLGLSIVQRIGRVLKQPVSVVSTVGKGSMFAITVPVAGPVVRKGVEGEVARAVGSLGGLSVLCVDNEPRIVESMRMLLEGWGCTVSTAHSQAECLEVITRAGRWPDAILADYHLDQGTGLEAIEAIRAKAGASIPATIITADQSPELQRELREREIPLLRKPLKPAALRAVLGQVRQALRSAAE
ncbi:MAG: response regulator [Rhizobiales bacterium]|nr:response regulator [Hyphomicrobiales bacterium]